MTSPTAPPTPDPGVGCPCPSRRTVLRTALLAGGSVATVGLVTACGSSEGAPPSAGGTSSAASSSGGSSGASGSSGAAGSSAPSGAALGPVSDVPVGGGVIFSDARVVVTQPTRGSFLAFSTTCTHQGCPVTEVIDGEIVCPCHGSHFSVEDGSPVAGPATAPLAAEKVSVDGDQLVLG